MRQIEPLIIDAVMASNTLQRSTDNLKRKSFGDERIQSYADLSTVGLTKQSSEDSGAKA